MIACDTCSEPRRKTAEDPLLLAVVASGILLALLIVGMLLFHPGSCGLAVRTLGGGVTVHGPAVAPTIRLF